jgi:hypothetical protein
VHTERQWQRRSTPFSAQSGASASSKKYSCVSVIGYHRRALPDLTCSQVAGGRRGRGATRRTFLIVLRDPLRTQRLRDENYNMTCLKRHYNPDTGANHARERLCQQTRTTNRSRARACPRSGKTPVGPHDRRGNGYGCSGREWKSYSPKYGWTLRLKQKKRTILYLSRESISRSPRREIHEKALVHCRCIDGSRVAIRSERNTVVEG